MIRAIAGLALLLYSVALVAQNSASSADGQQGFEELVPQAQTVPWVAVITLQGSSCPIDMHASQALWDRTIKVRDGARERALEPFGQRISLNLKDPRSARIVGATLRVRGLNGKNRALPTPATETTQRWNAVRTLKVNFMEEKDGTVSADVRIGGITSVFSIQLLDVSYSDGSIWTISRRNACSIQPDPVMLISER